MPVLPHVSLESALEARRASTFTLFEGSAFKDNQFDTVVMGGTFDRLHVGHRKLLTIAAMLSRSKLIVGITDTEMLKRKEHFDTIQPYDARCTAVREFLNFMKPGVQLDIVRLLEPYGPTTSEPDIDAIVVSTETLTGAEKINQVRASRGFKPLHVVATQREHASFVSSSFLRANVNRDAGKA